MTDLSLTTYRVQLRCTLRSEPGGAVLARLGPTLDDGSPRLVKGRAAAPGWVEVVEGEAVLGYIRAGALRALQERAAP